MELLITDRILWWRGVSFHLTQNQTSNSFMGTMDVGMCVRCKLGDGMDLFGEAGSTVCPHTSGTGPPGAGGGLPMIYFKSSDLSCFE